MNRSRSRWLVVTTLGLGSALSAHARADCASDCSANYEHAMTACQTSNADPGSSDALQSCMDQAQATYGACAAQCSAADDENQVDQE